MAQADSGPIEPGTNKDTESKTRCLGCSCTESSVVFGPGKAQRDRVLQCAACSLMYIDRARHGPTPDEFLANGGHWELDQHTLDKQVRQIVDYEPIIDALEALEGQCTSVIEIGCGTGVLLNRFKERGWKAEGIELNRFCAPIAKDKYGLDLHSCDIHHARFDEATFDAALMLHVIEHLPDPTKELREIHRVLRGEGHLVLETPTYDSVPFKLLGHRERSVRTEGHLTFFTPATLTALLERTGFQVQRIQCVGRTLNVERFVHNIGLITGSKALANILQRLAEKSGLAKLKFYLNVRDMMRVFAVKR